VGPDQVLEHRLGDERIRSLVEKTRLVEASDLNELYELATRGDPRGTYAARVSITTWDGTRYHSGEVEGNINYPQEGWDEERLESKFRWLTGGALDAAKADELVQMVRSFDQVGDVRLLTRLLI
jgi:hypothetical protein